MSKLEVPVNKIARDTKMEKAELEEQVRLSNTEIETLRAELVSLAYSPPLGHD